MGVISASSSVGTLLAGLIIPWLLATSLQLPNLDVWRSVAVVITLPAILAALSISKTYDASRTKLNASTTIVEPPPAYSKRQLMKDRRLYLMSAALIGYVAGFDCVWNLHTLPYTNFFNAGGGLVNWSGWHSA
jgi:MFS family permease